MARHKVCEAVDLEIGQMKAFRTGGERIALYRLADGFHATQAQCTHMFAPLARGKILDDCEVRCPLHRARFDIRSGAVVEWANFPPGVQVLNALRGQKPLRTYPVSVSRGEVMVEIEEGE